MEGIEEMEDEGLPTEVWSRILGFMPPTSLIPLRTVCQNWKSFVDSDYPWVGYVEKYYGPRYEKAPFLADPTLTWQARFWRMSKLHSSWEKGDYSSEVLGGSFGHVRQMRLDGDKLAMNHGDKLHVYDMSRNQRVWKFSEDMSFGNTIPSFDLKGNTLVVPSMHDRTALSIYNLERGNQPNFLHTGHTISVVKLSSATAALATGGRKIQLWDQQRLDSPTLTLNEQHRGVVNCLELDQNLLTASHTGKKIRVWDVRTGSRVLTLGGHEHMIHCIAVNDSYICSGSKDRTVRMWDRRKTSEAITLQGHSKPIRALAMDDWKIVSGGRDHMVYVWQISTAQALYKIPEPESAHAVAFDHSSLYVAGALLFKHNFTPRGNGKLENGDCVLS